MAEEGGRGKREHVQLGVVKVAYAFGPLGRETICGHAVVI